MSDFCSQCLYVFPPVNLALPWSVLPVYCSQCSTKIVRQSFSPKSPDYSPHEDLDVTSLLGLARGIVAEQKQSRSRLRSPPPPLSLVDPRSRSPSPPAPPTIYSNRVTSCGLVFDRKNPNEPPSSRSIETISPRSSESEADSDHEAWMAEGELSEVPGTEEEEETDRSSESEDEEADEPASIDQLVAAVNTLNAQVAKLLKDVKDSKSTIVID